MTDNNVLCGNNKTKRYLYVRGRSVHSKFKDLKKFKCTYCDQADVQSFMSYHTTYHILSNRTRGDTENGILTRRRMVKIIKDIFYKSQNVHNITREK